MEEKETVSKESMKIKKNNMQETQFKLKTYFMKGFTYFLVIVACIVCYFAFLRIDDIAILLKEVATILQPIIMGLVFAYLLNPMVMMIERNLIPILEKKIKNEKKVRSLARNTGVFTAILVTIAVVVLLLNMVLPELYESIRDMIISLPGQMNDAMEYLEEHAINDSAISGTLNTVLENGAASLETWLRTDLISQVNQMMSSLTSGVISFFETLFNIAVGLIVSVYVLTSKEKFIGQCKKATYALFQKDRANLILQVTRKSNEIFGGFVIGKIIDSIIIGVICFVVLSILKMPYTLLVSIVVGVTNVIPFFGPFIGAIPSIILILLAEPIKGLYFMIFILLLQQFDGNILGPKILGNSTGLSAFWVVFSILLGGGMFGFIGMVMGVPTFAVLYYLVNMFLNQKLEKKKLPLSSGEFEMLDYIDQDGVAHKQSMTEQKENE